MVVLCKHSSDNYATVPKNNELVTVVNCPLDRMPKEKKKRGRRAEQARRKAQEDQSIQFADQTPLEFYDTSDQG